MTQEINKYGIYEVDHTKFGGLIYLSDFNTDHRGKDSTNGSQIASRIETDRRREEKLWKTYKNKQQYIYGGCKNVKKNDETKM